ncbi:MAG: hypothetical protein AAF202_12035, partial [Pseudomonadota bacterium]
TFLKLPPGMTFTKGKKWFTTDTLQRKVFIELKIHCVLILAVSMEDLFPAFGMAQKTYCRSQRGPPIVRYEHCRIL